jgi:branched-chain amino acid transport system substrate-binding protein
MKKLIAGILFVFLSMYAGAAFAADVKLGVIMGFTGPLESLVAPMGKGAELAIQEVSDSGALLGGSKVIAVRGDSTCTDASAGVAVTERLVTAEKIDAIVGAACSGPTIAMLKNVAKANGIVMISPSATSPALSTIEDDGLFFRTAPSDARQGQIVTSILKEMGIKEAALTYTNNDYGKGLEGSFGEAFAALGGTVAMSASHEDGKGDYSAEVGALSAAGAEHLVVFGYVDQGGKGIIQTSVDTGAFESFSVADGMIGDSLIEAIGDALNGTIGTAPGSASEGAAAFLELAAANGVDGDGPFRGESYDAAALIALSMQAAGSADRGVFASKVMEVANAPGEPIGPGELGKALQILADGGEIDYVGASDVELTDVGEAAGSYAIMEVEGGAFVTKQIR